MLKYHPIWKVSQWRKDKSGEYQSIWEEEIRRNILFDTGEKAMLSTVFARGLVNYGIFSSLYLGLAEWASGNEAHTLVNVAGEAWQGGGYSRIEVPINSTGASGQPWYIVQPSTYFQANSDVKTWTATGNWLPVNTLFLCTSATVNADEANCHLIAAVALSAERTLLSGDKLNASLFVGLSE